jgi:hypothetical protein
MTASCNPLLYQSSPYPNTWIQDGGGAVFAEPVLCLAAQSRSNSAPIMLQSSPYPTKWIQDGGAVFAEPVLNDRYLNPRPAQSSPYPTAWIQNGGGAVFAESVLCLTAQLPLQLCSHHAPPSPVPIQPRGSKMAAVCLRNRFSVLTAQLPLQLSSHHAPVLFLSVIIALILNLEWKRARIFLFINMLEVFRIRFRWICN